MPRPRHAAEPSNVCEAFGQLRSDYDAARDSRYRRKRTGVLSLGSSADYHYRSERHYFGMMELARDLYRNHCLIAQGIRRWAANVVQDGFGLDTATGSDALDDYLEARWKTWSEDPRQCDSAEEMTFHDMEQIIPSQVIVDGDILALLLREGSIELVEAHRLRTPSNTTRNVVLGVLLDQRRRRLEYWLTKDDIDPSRTVQHVRDIRAYPARDASGEPAVLHIYRPDRVSQTRGVTALAPMADTAGMGDDLFFAQLVKAQVASCYTIFRQMTEQNQIPGDPRARGAVTTETRPDGTTRRMEGVAPGMEIFGFPGETMQGFSPNVPNPEFFQHAMLVLTIVAVNLDLPLAVLLLDPSKTNFSGWRGAIDQARLRFRAWQQWLIRRFHGPVYRFKVRQWLAEDPDLQRLAAAPEVVDVFGHRWNPPSWPYIEPLKDAAADLLQQRNALNSPRRIQANRGRNWFEMVAETIDDNAFAIESAKKKADDLNQKFPDGQPVHWRELISLPTPDGVTVQVGTAPDGPPENQEAADA